MYETLFPSGGDTTPYTQATQAAGVITGVTLPYLLYTGPEQPSDPAAWQGLVQAYRSEIILRYVAWAVRQAPSFAAVQLLFTELRLWLPRMQYDEEEGLPSDEPIFSNVYERLERWRDLILLGPPGSGKSATLWQLALELARSGLAGASNAPLPLLARLSMRQDDQDAAALLRAELAQAALTDHDGEQHPLPAHRLLAPLLPILLKERRLVLLWDGLDEVPRGLFGNTGAAIEKLRETTLTKQLNIVTCRTDAYPTLRSPTELHATIKRAAIQALDQERISEVVLGRLGALLGPALLALLGRPYATGSAEMARTPLLLSMICEVYAAHREVPASQGRLSAAFVATRLAEAQRRHLAGWSFAGLLPGALAQLAFALTGSRGCGSAVAITWALEQLQMGAPAANPQQLLELAQQTGLVELAGTMLRFSHAAVQDYFAALALRDRLTGRAPALPADTASFWRYPEPGWQRGWEATLLLLASLEGAHSPLRPLLREAISAEPLVAARSLAVGSSLAAEPAALVRDIALEQIGAPGRSFAQRLGAGQALGLIGDPRFPVSLPEWREQLAHRNERFGEPTGYWCYVQPGAYHIGGWQADQPGATITLAGFWIGWLPITVAQFAPFLQTGYTEAGQQWWTPQGRVWRNTQARREPTHWDEPWYTAPNQPVIGVSWYEATAYCAWLSECLAAALPKGYRVRLPSEAEWEAAAAFDQELHRRPYPWGAELPTPQHAVSEETRLRIPAPVGCCPAGVAACGALDMLGNCEEWCSSRAGAYPDGSNNIVEDTSSDTTILLGPAGLRQLAVRGGWFAQRNTQLSCGQRFWHYAAATSYTLGFRVVLAPPSL